MDKEKKLYSGLAIECVHCYCADIIRTSGGEDLDEGLEEGELPIVPWG